MTRNKYLLTINSYFQTRNNIMNRIQMRYILYINLNSQIYQLKKCMITLAFCML